MYLPVVSFCLVCLFSFISPEVRAGADDVVVAHCTPSLGFRAQELELQEDTESFFAQPSSYLPIKQRLSNLRNFLVQPYFDPEWPLCPEAFNGGQVTSIHPASGVFPSFLQLLFPSPDGILTPNRNINSPHTKVSMKTWGEILRWTARDWESQTTESLYALLHSRGGGRLPENPAPQALLAAQVKVLEEAWKIYKKYQNEGEAGDLFREVTFLSFCQKFLLGKEGHSFEAYIPAFEDFLNEKTTYEAEKGDVKNAKTIIKNISAGPSLPQKLDELLASLRIFSSIRSQLEGYETLKEKLESFGNPGKSWKTKYEEQVSILEELLQTTKREYASFRSFYQAYDQADILRLWRFADLMRLSAKEDLRRVKMALWGYIYARSPWTEKEGFQPLECAYEGYLQHPISFGAVQRPMCQQVKGGLEEFSRDVSRIPTLEDMVNFTLVTLYGPGTPLHQSTVTTKRGNESFTFTNCFEVTLQNCGNMACLKEGKYDPTFWPEGSPWRHFYETYGSQEGSEVQDAFAQMVSGIPMADYARPKGPGAWTEVQLGVKSLIRVLAYLMNKGEEAEREVERFMEVSEEEKVSVANAILGDLFPVRGPSLKVFSYNDLKKGEKVEDWFGTIDLSLQDGRKFQVKLFEGHGSFVSVPTTNEDRGITQLRSLFMRMPPSSTTVFYAPILATKEEILDGSPRSLDFYLGVDTENLELRNAVIEAIVRSNNAETFDYAVHLVQKTIDLDDPGTVEPLANKLLSWLESGDTEEKRILQEGALRLIKRCPKVLNSITKEWSIGAYLWSKGGYEHLFQEEWSRLVTLQFPIQHSLTLDQLKTVFTRFLLLQYLRVGFLQDREKINCVREGVSQLEKLDHLEIRVEDVDYIFNLETGFIPELRDFVEKRKRLWLYVPYHNKNFMAERIKNSGSLGNNVLILPAFWTIQNDEDLEEYLNHPQSVAELLKKELFKAQRYLFELFANKKEDDRVNDIAVAIVEALEAGEVPEDMAKSILDAALENDTWDRFKEKFPIFRVARRSGWENFIKAFLKESFCLYFKTKDIEAGFQQGMEKVLGTGWNKEGRELGIVFELNNLTPVIRERTNFVGLGDMIEAIAEENFDLIHLIRIEGGIETGAECVKVLKALRKYSKGFLIIIGKHFWNEIEESLNQGSVQWEEVAPTFRNHPRLLLDAGLLPPFQNFQNEGVRVEVKALFDEEHRKVREEERKEEERKNKEAQRSAERAARMNGSKN